jgi:3-dehydroquinate dehydratase-2
VLSGPNLNLLGEREPEVYGSDTLDTIHTRLSKHFEGRGVELRFFQSNSEGDLIDAIHEARNWADGIVINPGAYAHYSYGVRDALSGIGLPAVEIHLSNIHKRESFRHTLVVAPVCVGSVLGFGWRSYLWGVEALLSYLGDAK